MLILNEALFGISGVSGSFFFKYDKAGIIILDNLNLEGSQPLAIHGLK